MIDNSNLPPGVTERMIPGNEPEPTCPHCEGILEHHFETSVEDQYGNDYEFYRCYPNVEATLTQLEHFAATGCVDLTPTVLEGRFVDDKGKVVSEYCEGCGKDL